MDIRSQIAPKGLEFRSSDFIISDKYATILTVVSYPKFISPGYLANLTSMSGVKVVIKHIPLPFSVIQKMINKEIADLKTTLTSSDATSEEKNNAYEKIKYITDLKGQEEAIEEKIKKEYNLESFVKIDNNEVKVVAVKDKHDSTLANKIMKTVQSEFQNKVYVTVKFET